MAGPLKETTVARAVQDGAAMAFLPPHMLPLSMYSHSQPEDLSNDGSTLEMMY